ncbi:hypothetical protein BSKO_00984 [Bryopsis sp. KO-2023]|nr:hypothetical protein BSKO_00984 [Bryopsis sp. KO-2023]
MQLSKTHDAGQIRVLFVEEDDECHIVSAGTDGKLCVLAGTSLEELASQSEKDAVVTALAFKKNSGRVTVGYENGKIASHKLQNLEIDKVIATPSLAESPSGTATAVRCLSFSPSQTILAASGDSEDVQLLDVNGTDKVIHRLFAKCGSRDVAYGPIGKFVASVTTSGMIHIWDVEEGVEHVSSKPDLARKVETSDNIRIGVSWHPDGGTLLAVPGNDNDVVMLERLSWKEGTTRSRLTGVHSQPVNLVAFSPNGIYAATAGEDNLVVIWGMLKSNSITKKKTPGLVTDLAWHPYENVIVFGMATGEVGKWSDVVPDELNAPTDAAAGGTNAAAGGQQGNKGEEFDYLFELEKDTPEYRAAKRRRETEEPFFTTNPNTLSVAPQKPVRPGATKPPIGNKAFYICYNQLGIIVLRNMGDHNIVEVTVNHPDLSRARVPRMHDFKGYTVGSIGHAGAVFASPSKGKTSGSIDFKPFNSWASTGEWSVDLEGREEAVCVAAGSSFVAAVTNTWRLGIFGVGGTRQRVWSLEGAPVALCAHKDLLAVVWHGFGSGTRMWQNLNYMVYNCDGFKIVSTGTLAITPGSTLEWIGFSEEGVLATYDSEGVLRRQDGEPPHLAWMPIFEAATERKSAEIFRIISVRQESLVCIVCTPINPFPQVRPPPVIIEIPLRVCGFASSNPTVTKLEDSHMLQQSLLSHKRLELMPEASEIPKLEAGIDSTLLKLFHEALKVDQSVQAFHIATGIRAEKVLRGALALANHHAMVPLAERLTKLLEDRMQEEDDDSVFQTEEFEMETGERSNGGIDATAPTINYSNVQRFDDAQENVAVRAPQIPPTASPVSQRKSRSNPFARTTR